MGVYFASLLRMTNNRKQLIKFLGGYRAKITAFFINKVNLKYLIFQVELARKICEFK